MALPVNRPLSIERIYAHNIDQSTAGSSFSVAPMRGKIITLGVINHVAVTSAPNVLTAKINGTAITIPTWTVPSSGAAAGDVVEVTPTGANLVNSGDKVEFISDGAGSATVPCTYYADIMMG